MPQFVLSEWQCLEINASEISKLQIKQLLAIADQKKWFSIEWNHLKPDIILLKSQNFVGQCVIPVEDSDAVQIIILPKIPITSLMNWWCWSNQAIMPSHHHIQLMTVSDIFEQLCCWLAHGVLSLVQQGLSSEYVNQDSFLSNIRGRISIPRSLSAFYQGKPELYCHYDQRTIDIIDNQILLWTLHQARKWPFRNESVRNSVNQAYRILSGTISLKTFDASTCFSAMYSRLNRHYQPLHQWCGMILSQITLSEQLGHQISPTFMLEISRIFEQAVANYLKQEFEYPVEVIPQQLYRVSTDPDISFLIDIIIRDQLTGRILAVLDTKYKHGQYPSRNDIFQIISYAVSQGCDEGILIYPKEVQPLNTMIGSIKLRNLSFDMSKPLKESGQSFIESLRLHHKLALSPKVSTDSSHTFVISERL